MITLKQIFELKTVPCAHLHEILKKLLAKVCFDASLMCLFQFVAFRATLNDLWRWTQRCGLLSRIQIRITDQNWQTGPNELVSHFVVGFVVCWHQNGNLVQVVYIKVSFILLKEHSFFLKFAYCWHSNKSSNRKAYFACIYMTFKTSCWEMFVSMLHLCVFLASLHFVLSLLIYAVERNIVVYCHAYVQR